MKNNYTLSFLFLFLGLFFSFNVQAQIIANSDFGTVTNSNTVQIAIQNVLSNDTLNGIPVTLSQVSLTQVSSTTGDVSLQPNGSVVVNASANTGGYTIYYQICEIANPNNCAYSYALVSVNPLPIVVGPETVTISTGLTAPQIILENVLSNDTLGGIPISVSDVTISQVTSTAGNYFLLDGNSANVILIGSPPAGTYPISYYYCINNTNNCVQATVTITVVNSLKTTIVGTYLDYNGDGITNLGDVVNYTYTIKNIGTLAVSNISISSTDVNINGGPPIAILNPNGTDSSTYTGVHAITQEDINSGNVIVAVNTNGTRSGNPIFVTTTNTVNLNIADGILMNAFFDLNGNGTQESGESNFTSGSFNYQLNSGTAHNIISPNGTYYIYETNATNSYNLGFTIDPAYSNRYSLATASYSNVTVPHGSGVVTYNFAITVLPFTDLNVYIYDYNRPRPGFTYTVEANYYNYYGNQTATTPTLTIVKDSRLTVLSTTPPGAVISGNNITFNLANVPSGGYGYVLVQFQVPTIPTVQLGDLITTTATITTPSNDIYPENNTRSITSAVVGAFDPNDKTESHGPQIQHSNFSSNDYLTYTIRFENTGTAEAINIKVTDVLDSKLDETSVKMIKASHSYVLDRVGRNLTWRFDGVNLEPSIPNNTTVGHGYIVFRVKPKPGYVIGDIIPNTASIYFDFNPAIVTNTWTTTFVPLLGVQNYAFENFSYHPNPVKNNLTLSSSSTIDNVEIISVLGQRVKSIRVNNLQTEIDLSELTKGIYFVKASSNGQEKTVKIIKE